MAKTRAQRKAEKRRRQQAQRQRQPGRPDDEPRDENVAQRETREGVSGEVAETEAVIETGARPEDYGEHVGDREGDGGGSQARSAIPGVTPEPVVPEPVAPEQPESPAPSRADVGRPAPAEEGETREQRRARRRAEKEREKDEKRRARERELQKAQEQKAEKRRGGVIGFFASCWAELKRVQWPDRDTLVQASAVTVIFVAVMAAYLGGLDAAFNWLIQRII
jgi:preprotein translocase subunit SecE